MKDDDFATSGFKYFLSDHLGSVSLVLGSDGTILEQQRYLPFGAPRTMPPYASVTSTDFTYTGQRDLPSTGLMDYKARFYSPYINRFLQPDTIIPDLSNPQSWNRYSYVYNSPIINNDPTGHCPMCLAAAPVFSFTAITQGIIAVGAAVGAIVASPIFLGAVAAVAVVAIGVIVYDKYIDATAINRANTVEKNHNDLNNGKKFPKGPCRGVRGKVYCGAIIGMSAAAVTNMFLEPVCKIRKEANRSQCDHGREIGSAFFISSSNATKLL